MQTRNIKVPCNGHTRAGKPCGNPALAGGKVCRMHGGFAPQVRMAAKERLQRAADPAAYLLSKKLGDVENLQPEEITPDQIRVAGMILDRAGLGPGQRMELVGAGGGPVKVEGEPSLRHLSDQQLAELREWAAKAIQPAQEPPQIGDAPVKGPVNGHG